MRPAVLALAALLLPSAAALAQTANVSPTSPSSVGAGNVSRAAPSGSTARPDAGQPQIGAPTPVEEREERKSEKDVNAVCRGC